MGRPAPGPRPGNNPFSGSGMGRAAPAAAAGRASLRVPPLRPVPVAPAPTPARCPHGPLSVRVPQGAPVARVRVPVARAHVRVVPVGLPVVRVVPVPVVRVPVVPGVLAASVPAVPVVALVGPVGTVPQVRVAPVQVPRVVPVVVAVPAAPVAVAQRAPSVAPVVAPRRAGSPSAPSARSTRTCRPPRSVACGCPRGNGAVVRLPRGASLTDFAERINCSAADLVTVMFKLGEMLTATQSVDDDTLRLLGQELDFDVQVVSPEDEDRELLGTFDLEFGEDEGDESDLVVRPPVVTVMGHVDHGKTKLLDAIRSTKVVEGEAGGITQHIGAYQVTVPVAGNDRTLTFIDTPGHEAFTAMRARGAQVTDIAVLVVAADDGVKPQTVEALNHAQAAGVPIVVAVNKIDKEGADTVKVRGQLTEYGLVAEEFGGDTMFVDVSAKGRLNIDALLEAIVLTADATLDLRANPKQDAQGVAIEAHLDRGRGPVATVLVQRGTLRPGDSIVAGDAFGRVRAMLDEHGDTVDEATPARPVQVLGLTSVPGAGDSFLVVGEDRVARQIAQTRQARERNAQLAKRRGRRTLEDFLKQLETGEVQELNLILKGDVSGSVEALEDSLMGIDVGEEVNLRIIDRGVGAITETNVMLAAASKAVIIGFNVRPQGKATELADREGVDIRYYNVIYSAIDDIEAALKGMLKPEYEEAQLGTAEVREVFKSSKFGTIAGSLVRSGNDQAQQQGAPGPRRCRGGGQPHGRLAATVQGRRHRGARGLRVRHRPGVVQRHQGRRRDRDVRDAGEVPRLKSWGSSGVRRDPRC